MYRMRAALAPTVPLLVAALLAPSALVAQPPSGTTTFIDTVEVRVVNVDVLVLDRDGNPVTGLAREDFELTVDGRPTALSNFAAYEEQILASTGQASLQTDAAAGEVADEAPRAAPSSTWIVFVDQSNLHPGPRNEAVKGVRDFVATSLKPDDRSMVATYDGRSLKVLSGLTADRQAALDALAKLQKQAPVASALRGRASQIQRDIAGLQVGTLSSSFEIDNVRAQITTLAEEHALRLRGAMTAVRDLLAMVAGVEGRVALLWGGGGFETDPTANLLRLLQVRTAGRYDAAPDQRNDQDALTTQNRLDYAHLLKAVNASRVTVYSIFAGDRGSLVSAEEDSGSGVAGPMITSESPEGSTSLAAFATETGGRTFVGASDLAERLDAARTDLATYYSLGYHPAEGDAGGFHDVRVKVQRDGVRVVHRRGVQARGPEDLAADAATAALLAEAPPKNPFGAVIQIGDATKPKSGRGSLVPVVVRVPIQAITLLPDGNVHRAQLAFHFSVRDPDGGFRRLEPRPLDFSVPEDKLAAARGQSVAFRVELQLEPGAYQLGAAVVDKIGGATSVATTGFQVAKAR